MVCLDIISKIESDNRDNIQNSVGATGRYQIRQCVVDDFNKAKKKNYTLEDMKTFLKANEVARWYMEEEIPRMIRWYNLNEDDGMKILCWNWGITRVREWWASGANMLNIPEETLKYLVKYKTFSK